MSSNPLIRGRKNNGSANPLRRPNPTPFIKRESRDVLLKNGKGPASSSSIKVKKEPENGSSSRSSATTSNSSTSATTAASQYTDFKLRSCTAEELKDTRHHILKFHSKVPINPATDFTPPIRFHRKDPRNLQFQLTLNEMEQREKDKVAFAEQQAQRQKDQREAKEKQQELKDKEDKEAGIDVPVGTVAPEPAPKATADMSVVAPHGGARKTSRPFQKKTRQVILGNEATRKLRYEEYYPWIMEDFDGKNTWVGNYEAAQSDTYVLFVFDDDGFKMVPAEKWYKMTPRNKYTTLTLEEAEQRMEKKTNIPRWIMKHISEEHQAQATERPYNMRRRFKTVDGPSESRGAAGSFGGHSGGGGSRRRDDDHDEIDFDEEFADDEEAPIMDGNEEDLKEVEEKIKKEQRNANNIGIANEVDDDDTFDLFNNPDEPKIGKEGKKLKKYLRSLEKNSYYESDDDENPYASESEDTEEEDVNTTATTPTGSKVKEEPQLPEKIIKTEPSQSSSITVKTERRSQSPVPIKSTSVLPRKKYNNLPPGMVVLQLSPESLSSFTRNVWNPNAKRRRELSPSEWEGSTKKLKIRLSPSPPAVSSSPTTVAATTSNTVAADSANDENLLTAEDVRSIIASRQLNAKELLGILKPKLRRHPDNRERLTQLLREVAKLHKGVLVLKDSPN